jgi:excinuclease UvrABC nuclease subunit
MDNVIETWDDLEPRDVESDLPRILKQYFHHNIASVVDAAKPVPDLKRQGIYFLVNQDDEIEYVGQTVNLFSRLQTHERLKSYHKVSFLPVKDAKLLNVIEMHYIEYFNPRLNVKRIVNTLDYWRAKNSGLLA